MYTKLLNFWLFVYLYMYFFKFQNFKSLKQFKLNSSIKWETNKKNFVHIHFFKILWGKGKDWRVGVQFYFFISFHFFNFFLPDNLILTIKQIGYNECYIKTIKSKKNKNPVIYGVQDFPKKRRKNRKQKRR